MSIDIHKHTIESSEGTKAYTWGGEGEGRGGGPGVQLSPTALNLRIQIELWHQILSTPWGIILKICWINAISLCSHMHDMLFTNVG